jgi:hypothetical protein
MIENDKHQLPVFVGGMIVGTQVLGFMVLIAANGNLIQWILNHQPLGAGLIGVFAASFTSLILIWQIRQNYKFREDTQNRRLMAAKSTMPLVLADFTGYAETSFGIAVQMARGEEFALTMPEITNSHLQIFKECIESADDQDQRKLSELLKLYQLQKSRLRAAINEYRPWTEEKRQANQQSENRTADEQTITGNGNLFSSVELSLAIRELWAFARSDSQFEVLIERSERVENLFVFADEFPEDWQRFIAFFIRIMDRRKN